MADRVDARIAELEAENARLRELACWQEDDAEPLDVAKAYLEYGDSDFWAGTSWSLDGVFRWGYYTHHNEYKSIVIQSRGQLRRLIAALEGK